MQIQDIIKQNERTLIFIGGFVIGLISGVLITKDKFKKISNDEIKMMAEIYNRKKKEPEKEEAKTEPSKSFSDEDEVDRTAYESVIEPYAPKTLICNGFEIDILPPENYGDENYTEVSYDYYILDGILKDEMGEVMEINDDLRNVLEKSEINTVYFRDAVRKIDYEVLIDRFNRGNDT